MNPASITQDSIDFTEHACIPQLHHLPDEIEHRIPRSVHHYIAKLLERGLPGKRNVEQYFRYQYIRNRRPNTIKITYGVLVPFLVFLKEVGKDGLKEVNRDDVEAFIEHEQDRGLKITTVKTSLAVLKAFFRFLVERGDASVWFSFENAEP